MDFKELEKQLGIENNESEEDLEKLNQELDDLMEILDGDEDGMIKLDEEDGPTEINNDDIENILKEEKETNLEDIDTDAMSDISTYGDNSEETLDEEIENIEELEVSEEDQDDDSQTFMNLGQLEEEINKKLINKKSRNSTILIYSIVGFLIFLIIISILFFMVSLNRIKVNNLEKEIQREREKVKATYIPEEKNAAYLGIAQSIDNIPLTLEKVLVDPFYLKFYISGSINPINYKISLTDNAETLYSMDTNFIKIKNEEIEIRFNRNGDLVSDYELKFESLSTGDKTIFKFKIPSIEVDKKVKYVNNTVEAQGDGFNINITGGKFSSSGSSIYYTFESDSNSQFELQQGFLDEKSPIVLSEADKEIEPLVNKPISQKMENGVTLGRMDFENISDLNSNLVVTFNSLYKKYNINKTLTLNEVNSGDNIIEFDKYKLFLEGMPVFDDKFVLVFHGEDTTVSTENRPEDFNRVEVLLDAEMYIENSSGMEVILKPTSYKSATYGTDIVFEVSDKEKGFLNTTSKDSIKLKINGVLMKTNPVYIPINLGLSLDREVFEDQFMTEEIEKAFISRLDYTYAGKNHMSGFAPEVLQDEKLMNEYKAVPDAKDAKYNINFISKKLEDDTLYAIVQDVVKYNTSENEIISYKNHRIKATYSDGKWTIISDEIIK